MNEQQQPDSMPASLDDVLATEELARRPSRAPDHEARPGRARHGCAASGRRLMPP
jgi:hypothetical protein